MWRYLMQVAECLFPCKHKMRADMEERQHLLSEHYRLSRKVQAEAMKASRRLRPINVVMILQTADEVRDLFGEEEGGGHDPTRGQ